MESIPLSVFEAAVQVAGSALHYKDSLKQLLRSSGVSANGAERSIAPTGVELAKQMPARVSTGASPETRSLLAKQHVTGSCLPG